MQQVRRDDLKNGRVWIGEGPDLILSAVCDGSYFDFFFIVFVFWMNAVSRGEKQKLILSACGHRRGIWSVLE